MEDDEDADNYQPEHMVQMGLFRNNEENKETSTDSQIHQNSKIVELFEGLVLGEEAVQQVKECSNWNTKPSYYKPLEEDKGNDVELLSSIC